MLERRAGRRSRSGSGVIPNDNVLYRSCSVRPATLQEIFDVLCHMDSSHIDGQAVEPLFGVGPRPATDGRTARHPGRQRRRFGDLPAAIRLTPRELHIAFSSASGLAAKRVEFSQAMTHDWTGFMGTVEECAATSEASRRRSASIGCLARTTRT